ncbi:MAG TPA: metallophosphoesterase [Oligoflexia bacterium]|nr:metallophosphoesterase [Oligoflexia bacterium]
MGLFQVKESVQARGNFRIVSLTMTNEELPEAFDGYSFVQVSDLHLGLCTKFSQIAQAFEHAQALRPDLLLITGDLIQYGGVGIRHFLATRLSPGLFRWIQYRRKVRRLAEQLAALFAAHAPPDGIIGVYGNHEYHEGIGTIRRKLDGRIIWLKNTVTQIQRGPHQILFYGLDDFRHGRPSIKRTFQLPPEVPADNTTVCRIFLAHNPDSVLLPNADMLSGTDLVLCGHTHGGQICLPGGKPILTHTHQRHHVAGLSMFHSTPVYVSRGVGQGILPIRMFCPPEITLVTLKKGTAA